MNDIITYIDVIRIAGQYGLTDGRKSFLPSPFQIFLALSFSVSPLSPP